MKPRLEYFPRAPELMQAVLALNKAVEESGLERSLLHLLKLRASQINRVPIAWTCMPVRRGKRGE